MTPIQSLITEMQAAEHGTPELSEKMAECLGWEEHERGLYWLNYSGNWVKPSFTTSLDAILAEIERVFPRAATKHYRLPPMNMFQICKSGGWFTEDHPTSLPLAACIALLRAIEARDMEVGR